LCSHQAVRAGTVLHNEWLAEVIAHFLAGYAYDGVGDPPGPNPMMAWTGPDG